MKDNKKVLQMLNVLAKSNDKKNDILEDMVIAMKDMAEQIEANRKHTRINHARISALEVTISHLEKVLDSELEKAKNNN